MQSGEYIPSKQGKLEEEHYDTGNMIAAVLAPTYFSMLWLAAGFCPTI